MTSPDRSFHSVSVLSRGKRCTALEKINELRFFPEEAPQLPLSECDLKDSCRCRYRQWSDRRHEDDRRSPFPGIAHSMYIDSNRRSGDDRRERQGASD